MCLYWLPDRGRRGRDRMIVGFTTTYAITAYYHWCCEFESRSGWGVQHYMIKFDSDLWQVGGFLLDHPGSSTNRIVRHDIVEILLKVALNTIKQQTNIDFQINLLMKNKTIKVQHKIKTLYVFVHHFFFLGHSDMKTRIRIDFP